jgi:DNA-binding GntR family transcriptional regulator
VSRAATPIRVDRSSPGRPLLTMERSAYDEQGRAVEHGDHVYRASRYSFDLTLAGW